MARLVNIKLHGDLGERIGAEWNLAVKSVGEAVRGIQMNSRGKLYPYLIQKDKEGVEYQVLINGREFLYEQKPTIDNPDSILTSELVFTSDTIKTIDIIPVLRGAKSGWVATILGVLLIIVAVALFIAFPGTAYLDVAIAMVGIGLIGAGITALLSKPPKFADFRDIAADGRGSYLFNGPQNTVAEGGPVPVGYGRLLIGSQVISAAYQIVDENVPPPTNTSSSTTGPIEAQEGVIDIVGQDGITNRAVSLSRITTTDLLCEGEIDGLVRSTVIGQGIKGEIGYRNIVVTPYESPTADSSVAAFRSVFFNEIPIVNNNRQFNFQTAAPPISTDTEGLVAHWKFDEGIGTAIVDSSSSANNATAANTTWVAGQHAGALSFNGTTSLVTVNANSDSLNFNKYITITAWIKPTTSTGLQNILIHGYSSTPNTNGNVFLRIYNGSYEVGGIHLGLSANDTVKYPVPTTDLGNWVFIAAIFGQPRPGEGHADGWGLYHYGPGVDPNNDHLVAYSVRGNGAVTAEIPWTIGGSTGDITRGFNGAIDDVRIYNRALNATEIAIVKDMAVNPNAEPPTFNTIQWTPGTVIGDVIGSNQELTISRTIAERLRFSSQFENAKYYRIFNKNCTSAEINIRIAQLYEQKPATGDTVDATVDWIINYRPLYADRDVGWSFPVNPSTKQRDNPSQHVKGKITEGYIRSTRIVFNTNLIDRSFMGWELRIVRTNPPESTSGFKKALTFVDSITEIYNDHYCYPSAAIVHCQFDATFFNSVPARAFDVKMLKVKIPSNYDPIRRCYLTNGRFYTARADITWDGTFAENKQWTDNPVWCFYDLLTNSRYGLGNYIDADSIDIWSLFQIAVYCDELVDDGYGKLEPRFSCNMILNTREEAYQVLNDMASIFNAMVYFAGGAIFASADQVKTPVVQFTNASVEDGEFIYASSSKRTRHSVATVRYNDPRNFYKPAIEYIEDIEGIRRYGIRETDATAFACTSRGQAVRLGRWILLSERLETETVSCTAGLEGAYLRPGDVFQVFDSNKKAARLAGRTYSIEAQSSQTTITLDDLITLDATTSYTFSLLTPTFYYNPESVDGLNYTDVGNIRRSQLQKRTFTGADSITVDGRTQIIFLTPFDSTNYSLRGELVWMIEPPNDTVTHAQSVTLFDQYTNQFRVIKTVEKDENKFEIAGLQYYPLKFGEIDSGLFLERGTTTSSSAPNEPGSFFSNASFSEGSAVQGVDYSFVVDNATNVTNYQVYVKNSPFIETTGVPSPQYLNSYLPLGTTQGTFQPDNTGTYYFRVYGYNDATNTPSSGFASGSVQVTSVTPIYQLHPYGLSLEIANSGQMPRSYSSQGEPYVTSDTISPTFSWSVATAAGVPPTGFPYFRVSIRKPTETNVPGLPIYHEELIDFSQTLNQYKFDFSKNVTVPGGPYRDFDVVVEGVNPEGLTSAGNVISGDPWEGGWLAYPQGYDIVRFYNAPVTGVMVSSGNSHPSNLMTTGMVTTDGTILWEVVSGTLPSDVVGGLAYYWSGAFDTGTIASGLTGRYSYKHFDWDTTSQRMSVPTAIGLRGRSGFMALSFFDSFDNEAYKLGVLNRSGVSLTNVTALPRIASADEMHITNSLFLVDPMFQGNNIEVRVTGTLGNYNLDMLADDGEKIRVFSNL